MMNEESEIQPGSFRPADFELPEVDEISEDEENKKPLEAESHPDLMAKYSLFRDTLHPQAKTIYHPCGANDVSPSKAFPKSRVIYVEMHEKSVEALKRGGFEVYLTSALEFNPGKVDILILLNPAIDPDIPSSYVNKDGFVLCNNYHSTASKLKQKSQFQLRGVIRKEKNGQLIFDDQNLEDFDKEIETDEEFQNAPFDWGSMHYSTARDVVEAVTGKKNNVLEEYKKILSLAREQEREYQEKKGLKVEEEDLLIFNHQGRQFFLETNLPKKKGTVDDIFVFQKIKENQE